MSASTSTVALRRSIRQVAGDPEIKAAIFRIESPGGTSAGMAELADDMAALSAAKPTVAYIEDLGASAAYYFASQARRVVANQAALVGSIGTYMVVYDYSGMAARDGVKVHVVRAGEFKGMGTPGTEVTPKQLNELQRIVNAGNEMFLSAVQRGRKMEENRIRELADGRAHPAKEAMSLGLIDAVQTFDQAMADLKGKIKSTQNSIAAGGRSVAGDSSTARTEGPESETCMSQSNAAQPTIQAVAEPKPASIAELKAAFQNDPSFALEAAEKAFTMTEAKAAYADVLAARLQQREQELDAAKKPAGNKPLGTGESAASNSAGDPVQAWEARMSELMGQGGRMSREQAARHIVVTQPELHQAYIKAANESPRKARR